MSGQAANSLSDVIRYSLTDDVRQLAYLLHRRAELSAQADALREQTNEYWQKAWKSEQAGGYTQAQELEQQAANSETVRARVCRALQSIEDELSALLQLTN
jgi:Arc/MetJ-type ribon-helix-helix transcriptional regulator